MSRVALLITACTALLEVHGKDTEEITRVKTDYATKLAQLPPAPAADSEAVSDEEKAAIDDLLNKVAAALPPKPEAVQAVAEAVPTVAEVTPEAPPPAEVVGP